MSGVKTKIPVQPLNVAYQPQERHLGPLYNRTQKPRIIIINTPNSPNIASTIAFRPSCC